MLLLLFFTAVAVVAAVNTFVTVISAVVTVVLVMSVVAFGVVL